MKLVWIILIILAIFLILADIIILYFTRYSSNCDELDQYEKFKNNQLIQFTPTNADDVFKIAAIQDKLSLRPWTKILKPNWPFVVQVPSSQTKIFAKTTSALNLPFIVLTPNLQEYLINGANLVTDFKLENSSDFNLNRYHYFDGIEKYLNKLAEEHTDKLTLNSYGTSIENRNLYYVRIFEPVDEEAKNENKTKKIAIFECGIHSREWLSPAVCLHIINKLVNDAESQSLLKDYDFFILPLINPDGYSYSWTKDRMWRKNRRRFANNCYGVDLNRNFNVGFNASETPVNNFVLKSLEDIDIWANNTRFKRFKDTNVEEPIQCSSLYGGERYFSENETFYLKTLIDRFLIKPSVYISLHAYSRMWLYPFGITQTSPNDSKLRYYAKIGVEALEKSTEDSSENKWKFGQTIELMYKAGGTSIDWAHKDVGIDLAYTIEMRDSGEYGFLLPEDEIEPAANEVWTGTKAVLEAYAKDSENSVYYETKNSNSTSD